MKLMKCCGSSFFFLGMAQIVQGEDKLAKAERWWGVAGLSHLGSLDAFFPAFLGVPVDVVRLQLLVVTRAGLGRVQL